MYMACNSSQLVHLNVLVEQIYITYICIRMYVQQYDIKGVWYHSDQTTKRYVPYRVCLSKVYNEQQH